jgi:AraC-like DNA-binding protein
MSTAADTEQGSFLTVFTGAGAWRQVPRPLWVSLGTETPPPPARPWWMLYCLLRGSALVQHSDATPTRIGPGTALLVRGDDPAWSCAQPSPDCTPLRVAWTGLDGVVHELLESTGATWALDVNGPLVRRLLSWRHAQREVPCDAVQSFRIVGDLLGAIAQSTLGASSPDHRLVRQACALVEGEGGLHLGVAEVASRLGVTPDHLARVFRAELGLAPAAYIQKRRIAQACRLLRDTRLDIDAIARAVGYSHSGSLDRPFIRLVGMTPSAYRLRGSEPLA